MTLSRSQLCMLRCLKRGWPIELLDHLFPRVGGTRKDWQQLIDLGFVDSSSSHFVLSATGKSEFKKQSKGKYF